MFLSGEKIVLLKAFLAAMPSYAISCFKLPHFFYKHIQSGLTDFWWDNKPENYIISWVARDKLTLPKNDGNLDFREAEPFTNAWPKSDGN